MNDAELSQASSEYDNFMEGLVEPNPDHDYAPTDDEITEEEDYDAENLYCNVCKRQYESFAVFRAHVRVAHGE